jgi:hypothetical protein
VTATEYEGAYSVAARLRLELIIVIQRSKKERGARREGRKGMAVRVGRIGICSRCLAHAVERVGLEATRG